MHPGKKVRYQLQPAQAGPLLVVVLVISLIIFLLPVVVNAMTPNRGPAEEPVVLSSYDSYEEIPLELDGRQLECVSNDLSPLLWGYDCHEVLIDSILVDDSEDDAAKEHTLRRMLRAGTSGVGDVDAPITEIGNVLVIIDNSFGVAGMSFPTTDGRRMYVQLDVYVPGPHIATFGEAVWQSAIEEPLPESLAYELATLQPEFITSN